MPKLGLRPYATITEGLDQYLGYNFSRLENVFERIEDVRSGLTLVTGDATFPTGLAVCDGVTVCLFSDPTASAAFVTAQTGASGNIHVRVFASSLALSTVAVNVSWIATGELVLA